MKNNGYTKIPNAIIRSTRLTIEAKLTWMFIASMPRDYQFTVGEACGVLRINIKTWRRCVAALKEDGLIEVDMRPGKKNLYRVLPPSVSDPGSQTVPLPNETPTPPPFEYRGTHSNNKEQLKNNSLVDARARMREEVMTDAMVEMGCMSLGIDRVTYYQLADQVFNDWQFQDLPDSEWNKAHFLAVMRIKINAKRNEQRTNNKGGDGAGDALDKLNQDALKAMAALAAESRQPKVVPF